MRDTNFQEGYRVIYGTGASYPKAWSELEKHMNDIRAEFDVEYLPGSGDKDNFKGDEFIASQRVILRRPVPAEPAKSVPQAKTKAKGAKP